MPAAPLRVCLEPGCSARVPKGRCQAHVSKGRDAAQLERRKLYKTKRWERFSKAYRDRHPLCAECERQGHTVLATDVHHTIPIQAMAVDPFDEDYIEGLCKPCHAKATAAEERARAQGKGITAQPQRCDDDRFVIA